MSDDKDWAARHYTQSVEMVARKLRDMADEVEREGVVRPENEWTGPPFGWAASKVVHAVAWGTANLNLDLVVTNAAQADCQLMSTQGDTE